MTSIRHLGWTAFALIGLAGCESPTPPAPPTAPTGQPSANMPDPGKSATPPANMPDPGKNATPPPDASGKDASGKDAPEIKAVPVEPAKTEPSKGASVEKLSDEEVAEIKKLPADEQAIALKQVVCPVSGDHLGEPSMGAPIKQVLGDKTFFLCCAGCEKKVKSDPDAVLANLKK